MNAALENLQRSLNEVAYVWHRAQLNARSQLRQHFGYQMWQEGRP